MDAEAIAKRLCYRPFGITVEDVQSRIDGFQGPYKYQAHYVFNVVGPFLRKIMAIEQAEIDIHKASPKQKEKAKPKQDALTIKIEKNNARVMYEWDEFQKKHGDCNYDELTEEAKQAASDIVDLQSGRDLKLFGKCKI